jgi:hypothetical protein
MENLLSNKLKFFALYYGQKVMFHEIRNNLELPLLSVKHYTKRVAKWKLELKPISSIADEDVEYLTSIWSKGAQYPSTKDESINLLAYYASRDYATMAHDIVDYLRSKGYALPFLGLSVESQISYGWVKLAEVC